MSKQNERSHYCLDAKEFISLDFFIENFIQLDLKSGLNIFVLPFFTLCDRGHISDSPSDLTTLHHTIFTYTSLYRLQWTVLPVDPRPQTSGNRVP